MRRASLVLALAFATSALGSPVRAKPFEDAVAVSPGGVVELDVDFGEGLRPDPGFIELAAHDADEVRVRVESSGWGSWAVESSLEERGQKTRISVRVGGATSWMFGGPSLRIFAWVPRGSSVDVRSNGLPLRIEEIQGSVRARTRDAGIELRGVEGPARLRAVNGEIQVEELSGDLEVTSTNGAIQVRWVGGNVEARTSDGSIVMQHVDGQITAKTLNGEIELSEIRGPVVARTERGSVVARFSGPPAGSLETERGSVDVVIPKESAAEIDARSTRGSVHIASGIALNGDVGEQYARGRINGGGALLVLRTSRGQVRLGWR